MSEVYAKQPQQPVELHQDRNGSTAWIMMIGKVDQPVSHGERFVVLRAKEVDLDHRSELRSHALRFVWDYNQSGCEWTMLGLMARFLIAHRNAPDRRHRRSRDIDWPA
jgi:hypothetical protein